MTALYMATTTDKYELPLFVADSSAELSRKFGINVNTIRTNISRNLKGSVRGMKFVKVEIEDQQGWD